MSFPRESVLFFLGALLLQSLVPNSTFLSAQEKVYEIADLTARLELRMDGSYHVREEITYDFQVGSFTFAVRDIPLSNTDGVGDVTVQSSGVTISEVLQEEEGDSWRVRWEFPEATGLVTFVMEYNLLRAVRIVGETNEVFWRVVGEGWDVPFRHITAEVVLPGELSVPASAVSVDPPEIATVVSEGEAVTARFVLGSLPAGRAYQVRVAFPTVMDGRLVGLARTEIQALLAGLLGSILLLAVGGIVAYRKGGVRLPPRRQTVPGVDIPTAAILLHKTSPGWDRAFPATLFDLASRSVLSLERFDKKGRVITQQKVRLLVNADSENPLTEFELNFLGELQEFQDDLEKFASSGKKYRKEAMEKVRESLVQSGSLQDGRRAANRALLQGLLLLLLFFAAFVVAAASGHPWLAALAGVGCGAAGGIALIGGARFPITRQGAEEVAALKGYLEGLREEFKQKVKMSPIEAAEFFFFSLPWLTLDPKYHGEEGKKLTKVLKKETRGLYAPPWAVDRTREYEKAVKNKSAAYATFLPFSNITGATSGAVAPGAGGGVGGAGGGGAAGGGGGGAG